MCRRFGTLGLFQLRRSCEQRPMKMEQTDCSETSAHKIQTPGNHPKEKIQQNLIRHPVKFGLPEGTKGPIEAHHRATFPVLHKCVYASYSYGCIHCALCWSNWILGRPRRRWEDNIKMDLQKVGGGCGNWIELTQDRDRWRALVSTVMNFRVLKKRGISWLAAEPVSFARRTLFHGVCK